MHDNTCNTITMVRREQQRNNYTNYILSITFRLHWKKNGVILTWKVESLAKLKLKLWLDIENQFDSNILQLLLITGRILVSPVTQLFTSKWLHIFFQTICFFTATSNWNLAIKWNVKYFLKNLKALNVLYISSYVSYKCQDRN